MSAAGKTQQKRHAIGTTSGSDSQAQKLQASHRIHGSAAESQHSCAKCLQLDKTPSAPSRQIHGGMESSLLEAAETGPAEVEPCGHKLHVSLLQDVLDDLRDGMWTSRRHGPLKPLPIFFRTKFLRCYFQSEAIHPRKRAPRSQHTEHRHYYGMNMI